MEIKLPVYSDKKLLEKRVEMCPNWALINMAIDSLLRLLCVLNATQSVGTEFCNRDISTINIKDNLNEVLAATILSLIEIQALYNNFNEVASIMGEKMRLQHQSIVWALGQHIFDDVTTTNKQILNSVYGTTVGKEKKNE